MVTKSNAKANIESTTDTSALLKELEKLKKQVETLSKEKNAVEPIEKVNPEEYIPVMSLIPYPLNLSTKEGGQGTLKRFTKFGEIKKILYKDLVDIIEHHSNFVESGYFYIMHPQFIRQHGLDEIYSKILTKEMIEEIISAKTEEGLNLYNSANETQKEIIIQMLIDKVRDNVSEVNLNMVDKISRASGIDITKRAEESRQLTEEEKAE